MAKCRCVRRSCYCLHVRAQARKQKTRNDSNATGRRGNDRLHSLEFFRSSAKEQHPTLFFGPKINKINFSFAARQKTTPTAARVFSAASAFYHLRHHHYESFGCPEDCPVTPSLGNPNRPAKVSVYSTNRYRLFLTDSVR